MYYQQEDGFYVYRYDYVYEEVFSEHCQQWFEKLHKRLTWEHFKTLPELFRSYNEYAFEHRFSHNIEHTFCMFSPYKRRGWLPCRNKNCNIHSDGNIPCYVVYDHNGYLYTPSKLIELYREWRDEVYKYRKRWYVHHAGYKKGCWGGYHYMRTFQERKWANAWDDEEYPVKVRARRNAANLPTVWDDYRTHAEKSWKWQSKRRHQWKPKN